MTRITAVVFDWGGVLTDPPLAGLERYGVELGLPSGVMSAFVRGDDEFAKVERGELSAREFLKGVCVRVREEHGVEVDIRRLASAMSSSRELNPAMVSLIEELSTRFDLAVLTNNVAENKTHLADTLPTELFLTVLNSADVGVRKPDPAIYQELVRRLDRDASELVYIDDFEENLPPAAELGMTTILFKDPLALRGALRELNVCV